AGTAAAGVLPAAGTTSVAQFLRSWLEAAKPSVCKGTLNTYRQHVNDLITPKLGGVRLAKLTSLHVEHLYRALAEDGHSAARQRHAGVTLRVALSWAVHHRMLPDNPAKRVKMPKVARREIRPLTAEQIAAFPKAAEPGGRYALSRLALDSGCREGELLGLVWSDVDFDRGTVAISRSLSEVGGELELKPPKTERSRRTVVLSQFTRDVL